MIGALNNKKSRLVRAEIYFGCDKSGKTAVNETCKLSSRAHVGGPQKFPLAFD